MFGFFKCILYHYICKQWITLKAFKLDTQTQNILCYSEQCTWDLYLKNIAILTGIN